MGSKTAFATHRQKVLLSRSHPPHPVCGQNRSHSTVGLMGEQLQLAFLRPATNSGPKVAAKPFDKLCNALPGVFPNCGAFLSVAAAKAVNVL